MVHVSVSPSDGASFSHDATQRQEKLGQTSAGMLAASTQDEVEIFQQEHIP